MSGEFIYKKIDFNAQECMYKKVTSLMSRKNKENVLDYSVVWDYIK